MLSLLRPRTPFGCVELVAALQRDSRDAFDDVDQLVDRDQLIAADVERLIDLTVHQPERALEAVVDVGEATRLLAVAPDLDLA